MPTRRRTPARTESAAAGIVVWFLRVLALIARAGERGFRITIPATALAQAIRSPSRQARLCRLLRQPDTDLVPVDGPDATAAGLVLARSARRK